MTPSKTITMRASRHSAGVRVIRLEKGFSGEQDRQTPSDGLLSTLVREINTPIGVGLTAATNLEDLVASFAQAAESGTLSAEERASYVADIAELSRLISRNLLRAADLIRECEIQD